MSRMHLKSMKDMLDLQMASRELFEGFKEAHLGNIFKKRFISPMDKRKGYIRYRNNPFILQEVFA